MNSTRRWLIGVALVAALTAAGWYAFRNHVDNGADTAGLMRESAVEAGLEFRMTFLPNEQGENFKINLYDHGCGLACADFDGDGHEDVYFVNQLGGNALYRNRGDGTFEDVTAAAGVALDDRICVAATFADYDNDGKPDLFVTSTRGGNTLFHNLGGGKFRDVSQEAGVGHVGHSQTALFFDFDNDGWLDLFVTNTAAWTTNDYDNEAGYYQGRERLRDVLLSPTEHNILYRNQRDGTFRDVTDEAGLQGRGWAGDAVAFDYNDDGHIDLFVTCMVGRCQLYKNDGFGHFTDVTLEALGRTPWGALGTKLIDFNNDGRLDLYVVDMHSDMWMGVDLEHRSLDLAVATKHRRFSSRFGPFEPTNPLEWEREKEFANAVGYRHDEVVFGNAFYRNDGGGKFTDITLPAKLEAFWPWGIAAGDFDNDGYEDLFLPSGMGYPYYYWPNALLMNQRNGQFRNRASETGIDPPPRGIFLDQKIGGRVGVRSSRCAVTADFDGDGRLEIVTNNFNDQPYFFRNQFPEQNYIALRLRGTRSNRDAVGAVVRLYCGDEVLTRQVQPACGYLSHSSRTLHFGLGERAAIDCAEITWPSGLRQQLDGLAVNRLHDMVEPEASQ
jgi:hypothetical protein